MSPTRRLALAAPLALLLAGCAAIGGPRTDVQVYAPVLVLPAAEDGAPVAWSLSIGTPAANRLLDSARIAVSPEPGRFQTYKAARWVDSAPELVQTALVQAFEQSGRIRAVGRFGGGGRSELGLLLELRAFESVYVDGQPRATVSLQARLVRLRGGEVLAARRFEHAVAAADPEVPAVVAAFGEALSACAVELVDWTLAEGERGLSAAAPSETSGSAAPR